MKLAHTCNSLRVVLLDNGTPQLIDKLTQVKILVNINQLLP